MISKRYAEANNRMLQAMIHPSQMYTFSTLIPTTSMAGQ